MSHVPAEAATGAVARPPSADEVRNALQAHGWEQGSILPDDLLKQVQRIPFAPPPADKELAVVIMTDCDAIQGDCTTEPALEVVVARLIATAQPNMKALKNPRLLHVEAIHAVGDRRQPIEVGVWSRGYIERTLLLDREPSCEWRLPPDALELIASLFSRRYDRSTFPDCFMERFQPVAAKFDKVVTRLSSEITGIFLSVDPPDEERPPDEDPEVRPYEVKIYLLMSDALCKDAARQKQIEAELRGDLVSAVRNTPGLETMGVQLVDPFKISLGEWMELTEWDHEPLRAKLAAKEAVKSAPARRVQVDRPRNPLD